MTVYAPPGTHESLEGDPNTTRRLNVCHLTTDGAATLCGERGLAMSVQACANPAASPCEGGCGRRRCDGCAGEL